MEHFTEQVIDIIQSIPKGKVTSYGQIAKMAGNPRGARQVVRILHNMSRKFNLPWHRVINSKGQISFPDGEDAEHQKMLLLKEGVKVNDQNTINLKKFGWI